MKTRIINLLIGLVLATAICLIPSPPPAPKETVTLYGPNYRLIKRPEARGAERWIFQRFEGTNALVMLETIIEKGKVVAALRLTQLAFSGGCVPQPRSSEFFDCFGVGGMAPILRMTLGSDMMLINDVPVTNRAAAIGFMNRMHAADPNQMCVATFALPMGSDDMQGWFGLLATNFPLGLRLWTEPSGRPHPVIRIEPIQNSAASPR